ncbi:MAG: GNAT family N-acetyltransferase [Gemmatimonadota bacterium]|nr:GNAT family N-acetyltransferase [Gemmatimonadota bacterium]
MAAWRTAYRGILADAVLAALSTADRAERWRQILSDPDASVLVLEPEHVGGVLGFAYLRSAPYADGREDRTGEIDSFNLDPAVWGRGAGRRLLAAIIEEARRRSFEDLTLWVFDANHRARRFYEAAGLTFDGTTVSHPRFKVPLLRYGMPITTP